MAADGAQHIASAQHIEVLSLQSEKNSKSITKESIFPAENLHLTV